MQLEVSTGAAGHAKPLHHQARAFEVGQHWHKLLREGDSLAWKLRGASPAMAVLPTPGCPSRMGLDLVRRART